MSTKKQHQFQILDISWDDYCFEFRVTLYGKTSQNQSVVCHLTGYKPYYYIKVPNTIDITDVTTELLETILSVDYAKKKYDYDQKISKKRTQSTTRCIYK